MFFLSKKKNLIESGTLRGTIDRHSHILPGVDDGIKTIDDSLKLLDLMEEAGVAEVWLTPHIMEDIPNSIDGLKARFEQLLKAYKGNIKLHLAAEHMLDNLFSERFAKKELLTMEDDLLLVETSYFNPPYGFENTLKEIMSKGYRPLLAHPERYKYMDMKDYARLKEAGVLFQLNLGAINGGYSPETQKKAKKILEKGWYNFFGSDVHSIRQYKNITSTPISKKLIKAVESIPDTI